MNIMTPNPKRTTLQTLMASGYWSVAEIAEGYLVHPSVIEGILSGETPEIERMETRGRPKNTTKPFRVSLEDAQAIREEYENTITSYTALSRKYGVSTGTIGNIVNRVNGWGDKA